VSRFGDEPEALFFALQAAAARESFMAQGLLVFGCLPIPCPNPHGAKNLCKASASSRNRPCVRRLLELSGGYWNDIVYVAAFDFSCIDRRVRRCAVEIVRLTPCRRTN
jgi:hypothetical protein